MFSLGHLNISNQNKMEKPLSSEIWMIEIDTISLSRAAISFQPSLQRQVTMKQHRKQWPACKQQPEYQQHNEETNVPSNIFKKWNAFYLRKIHLNARHVIWKHSTNKELC